MRDRYRVSSPFLKAQTGERKVTKILQGKGYTGNTVLYMVEAVLLHGHGVRQHQMEIRWESGFSNEELSIIGSDEIQHELLP
uniref:Uncharacterized protein n=1 Tax=Candidatus Kentrum sp. LFY TaxID=2126342 RepID=A0A450WPL2_9GAMM|nr:MAG: hypothetical protein BECKLFY1418C_GA0070996_105118 [Candidatus Kentron sp. LFY]